jgi:asparagine synthase (glutamine-hydrolysing)
MGGIVASLELDGGLADDGEIRTVCAAARYRGRGGIATWTSGPAGLGHLASTPLSQRDEQRPLVWHDGPRAITFDGRLDNREELRRVLEARDASDAALALAAYAVWGPAAPEHLIGDFAFAIWDEPARRLFCARDPLGLRPLYYWSGTRRFLCASDVAQILSAPGVTVEPNPGMIAEHLANAITSQDETVYAGIARLPHGHSLTVTTGGQISRHRYWAIDPERTLSCASDADYADCFRELFTEAVRCRMPEGAAVAIYLSGGMDSSAVTAAARAVSPEGLPPEAFSLVFGDDRERDEIRYIEDMCRHSGVRSHVTRAEDSAEDNGPAAPRDVLDALRDRPALAWKQEIRARGFRVVLSGQGGDHGLLGSFNQYADLLRRGRVLAMLRQWRADRRVPDSDVTASDLITSGMWPLLPAAVRRLLRPLARRLAGMQVVPAWMPAAFAQSVDLEDRVRPARDALTGGSVARWDVRRNYESGWVHAGLEAAEREAASLDLDERHPFFDRRVVEFAAALPDEQRCRGELTRVVVRHALADRLPPSIRTRTSAGTGSGRVVAAVEAMATAGVFGAMAVADAGWISQDAIEAMLRRMRERYAAGNGRYTEDALPLWIIGGTERWFRSTFGYTGGGPPESARAARGGRTP